MGIVRGSCVLSIAFAWSLFSLCGLRPSLYCTGFERATKQLVSTWKLPLRAPIRSTAGTAPHLLDGTTAFSEKQQTTKSSHAPYTPLKLDKLSISKAFASSRRGSSFPKKTGVLPIFPRKAPTTCACPSRRHPPVRDEAALLTVKNMKKSLYTRLVPRPSKNTHASRGSAPTKKTVQPSDFTGSVPISNFSGTFHTTKRKVNHKFSDTTQIASCCSRPPEETNGNHGKKILKTRKIEQEGVNCSVNSFSGRRWRSSVHGSPIDEPNHEEVDSGIRRSVCSYKSNTRSSSARISEAFHSTLGAFRRRRALHLRPVLLKAGSPNSQDDQRKDSTPCTDIRKWRGRNWCRCMQPTHSACHISAFGRIHPVWSTRTRISGSANTSATANRNICSSNLGANTTKSQAKENGNGNSSTASSNCSGVPANMRTSKGWNITNESNIDTATGYTGSGEPQKNGTVRATQSRRPVAIIRLRLCHFTDFHSAYEFNESHPLHKFPSCCPQDAAGGANVADGYSEQSTASCPANRRCTPRHERNSHVTGDADVLGGVGGGIWRVPVLQYILDSLCPAISPSNPAASHILTSTILGSKAASKPGYKAGGAGRSADEARTGAANIAVLDAQTTVDAKGTCEGNVRRDALPGRVNTTFTERERAVSYSTESAQGYTQKKQGRRKKTLPAISRPPRTNIYSYPSQRALPIKLPRRMKASYKTPTRDLLNQNMRRRMAAADSASPVGATSSPTSRDIHCNGDSVLAIGGGHKQGSTSGARPTQTEGSCPTGKRVWKFHFSAVGPKTCTLHAMKETHFVRESDARNRNCTSSRDMTKSGCGKKSHTSVVTTVVTTPVRQASTVDRSIASKGQLHSYVTKPNAGSDAVTSHAVPWARQAEKEDSTTRSGPSGRVATKKQEQRKRSVMQNEPRRVQLVPYSLRVFGGDAVPGSDFDALGAHLPGNLLKELKVQVATLGNHEFDRGWDIVDEMISGNQNSTTFVVSNALINVAPQEKSEKERSLTGRQRILQDTSSRNLSTEKPMRNPLQTTSTIAEPHSPRIKPVQHVETALSAYRKDSPPRRSITGECTLDSCPFASPYRVLNKTSHAPKARRKSVASHITLQKRSASAEKKHTLFLSNTRNGLGRALGDLGSRHLHAVGPTAAANAFPQDSSGDPRQKAEPDRSEYTVPYVLWLANMHGDSVLYKPRQLMGIHRVCETDEGEILGPETRSAATARAAASNRRPKKIERSVKEQSKKDAKFFLSLLQVKRPAAAVCLLGALPTDLRTSAAPPAEIDVSSKNSTQRIEAGLRECTQTYWELLRICAGALQKSLQPATQRLSRNTRARAKVKLQPRAKEPHFRSRLLVRRLSSCADSNLQQLRQSMHDITHAWREQPKRVAVCGQLKQTKTDRSEYKPREPAGVLKSQSLCEQSEQQRRQPHVNDQRAGRAAPVASRNHFRHQDSRAGDHGKHCSRIAQEERAERLRSRLANGCCHLDGRVQHLNATSLPRPIGILISHLGFKEEQRVAAVTGGAAGGIDFILSGHSHTDLPTHMFPAFVQKIKSGGMETALNNDATPTPNVASSVELPSASGNYRKLRLPSTFSGSDGDGEGSPPRKSERRKCEIKEADEELGGEQQHDDETFEGKDAAKFQCNHSMVEGENDKQLQKPKNTDRKTWQRENYTDTKRQRSSRRDKQMRFRLPKQRHMPPGKQHSSMEKQRANFGRGKLCGMLEKTSTRIYSHIPNKLGLHNDSNEPQGRSFYFENSSAASNSKTWQSGSFIITSASHGRRISVVDIYFLITNKETNRRKVQTNKEADSGITFTVLEKSKEKKGKKRQRRTQDKEVRLGSTSEDRQRVINYDAKLRNSMEVDAMHKVPTLAGKGVWWLDSEQLPPTFSTVDVDEFAAWASSATSFLGKSKTGNIAGTGRMTYTASSHATGKAKRATTKSAAAALPVLQTKYQAMTKVEGASSCGGTRTAPATRGLLRVKKKAGSMETILNVPSRSAAVFQHRRKSESRTPRQGASGSERTCTSHAYVNNSPDYIDGESSGSFSKIHAAAAYEFVCLEKTYGESTSFQSQASLRGADIITAVFEQALIGAPVTQENAGLLQQQTQWSDAIRAQPALLASVLADPIPSTNRTGDLEAISAAENIRRTKSTEGDARTVTNDQYNVQCSPTVQPIPFLLSRIPSFSFSSCNAAELTFPVQPNQGAAEAAAAATKLNHFRPFVACTPTLNSNQRSGKLTEIYRIPHFGWLPAYNTEAVFAPLRSEELHIGKQGQQAHNNFQFGQHLSEQNSLRSNPHSLQQHIDCLHKRKYQQQQKTEFSIQPRLRWRAHDPVRSHHRASKQQVQQVVDGRLSSSSFVSPAVATSIPPATRKWCYRLSSPIPLFPALHFPIQSYPPHTYRNFMRQAQGDSDIGDTPLVAGAKGPGNGAHTSGSAGGAAAANVTGASSLRDHIFCKAPVNAALVCPYSRSINKLRHERHTQTRLRGVAGATGVDGRFDACRRSECPMGRLVSDAMRYAALKALLWEPASANVHNGTRQEAAWTLPSKISALERQTRALEKHVSLLTAATAVRRLERDTPRAAVNTTPAQRTVNAGYSENLKQGLPESYEHNAEQTHRTPWEPSTQQGTIFLDQNSSDQENRASYTNSENGLERAKEHQHAEDAFVHEKSRNTNCWQKKREEKSLREHRTHQPVKHVAGMSASMLQKLDNTREANDCVERQSWNRVEPVQRAYLGVIAMQTSGNIRSSFPPNSALTDAEIDNVLPWSSHLRVIHLPVQDLLVLFSRSVQKLVNSGSCVLQTPEATRLFPHLLQVENAAFKKQTTPKPKAPSPLSPGDRLSSHACTNGIYQRDGSESCVIASKGSKFHPYISRHSSCSSHCSNSKTTGNTARERDRRPWNVSCESGSGQCDSNIGKESNLERSSCTILPFCAAGEKEYALQSPSILHMAGARLEVRVLQQRGTAEHREAAEHRAETADHVQSIQPKEVRPSAAGDQQAGGEMTRRTSHCLPGPALHTVHTSNYSTHAHKNTYLNSLSSKLPREQMPQEGSYESWKSNPNCEHVCPPDHLHAASVSVYIPVYPLPVEADAPQTEMIDYQYLFGRKGALLGSFLESQQEAESKGDNKAPELFPEAGEETDYLWVKVERTQFLDIRSNEKELRRIRFNNGTARRGVKNAGGGLPAMDNIAGNNHVSTSHISDERSPWSIKKMRERGCSVRCAKSDGKKEEHAGKDHATHRATTVEELSQGNWPDRQEKRQERKLGSQREVEADEATRGDGKLGKLENFFVRDSSMLQVYVQQRLLQQQPALLQRLQASLSPVATSAQTTAGTLMPCRRRSNGTHGSPQNLRRRPVAASTRAAGEKQGSPLRYMETNELFTLLPLCWMRQHIPPVTFKNDEGTEQLKQNKNQRQRRMAIGAIVSAVSRKKTSAAEGLNIIEKSERQISAAAEMRGEQTSRLRANDDMSHMVPRRQKIRQQADWQHSGHTRPPRKAAAQSLPKTGETTPRRNLPSRRRNPHKTESTGAGKDYGTAPGELDEDPAVVPLSSILLLGVADQFFLQGGDQLLLDDDEYTFNVRALPAAEPDWLGAGLNRSSPQSERRTEESLQERDLHGDDRKTLKTRPQGQHCKQRPQYDHHPHIQHYRDTFSSASLESLAVDAKLNNETARDALAEFIQVKHGRAEQIEASSLQRLLIQVENSF